VTSGGPFAESKEVIGGFSIFNVSFRAVKPHQGH
jgi:hypothetical protein